MIDLLDIRYVRLGTCDLGTADRLARDAIGLQGVRKEHGACSYRIDSRDHTLVHFEGGPADHRVGFELRCADALDAAGRRAFEPDDLTETERD
jgi:2,3-dihydroxy-p-cumate/2,3-dihydroxybenzoate 3,4-dioxygenase